MNNKYVAAVLALMVAAAQAQVALQQGRLVEAQVESKNAWEGLGHSATVNEYVDRTIDMLVPLFSQHGLDPMPLPDIEEGFSVRPVLITYSAWLRITSGAMTGLVNAKRSGDQTVNYFAKMLRLRIALTFEDLLFNYNYLVQVMNIGPTGRIRGQLSKLDVVVDLIIDFNNDEVHLQQFSLTEIGRLRVSLHGNILTDWLVNPVIGVFVRIFDTIIINVVEANVRNSIQDAIDVINGRVKEVLQHLESL